MKEPLTIPLIQQKVVFGCDPEFFFEKKGKVIGSEKVLDIDKGYLVGTGQGNSTYDYGLYSKFVVDGVQAELNPKPNGCRANLANEISQCFKMLYNKINPDKELSVNFGTTIKIDKKELMSLNEKSRKFGCMPSKNINPKSENVVNLKDPTKYRFRSAGGHIHLGVEYQGDPTAIVFREPERLVRMMDIIVGNTCVLIDRNPGNKERRKVYGKAGEYRTPEHGVEYRTLSNFWLRSYPLMSFVMGMSRTAISILSNSMPGRDYETELLSLVDMKKIERAINTNNFQLAWENFQDIKPFFTRVMPDNDTFPLSSGNLDAFEFFVSKGIDEWFKEDPIKHWMKIPEGHTAGWETFLRTIVKPKMIANKRTPAPDIK